MRAYLLNEVARNSLALLLAYELVRSHHMLQLWWWLHVTSFYLLIDRCATAARTHLDFLQWHNVMHFELSGCLTANSMLLPIEESGKTKTASILCIVVKEVELQTNV